MKRAIGLVAITLALGCATNPATGRRQLILLSEADEIQLGKASDAGVRQEMGAYDNADLQQYVDRIGQTLARASQRPQLPWRFAVVDESAVNAFALPGGFIYVTRGILPFLRDEAELAAVIGHEVGHVDAKHGVDQYSKQMMTGLGLAAGASLAPPKWRPAFGGFGLAAQFIFLKYGRTAELESDRLGVGYSAAAGWSPQAMQGVLATLGRLDEAAGSRRGIPNWALSHPPAEERVSTLQEAVAAAAGRGGTATNPSQFERMIDGLVFGDSREKGMIRGSEFVHPVMRFSVRFPEAWGISNGAAQVSASPKDQGSAVMILELAGEAAGPIADVARAEMAKAALQEIEGGLTRINGLEAYWAVCDGLIDVTPIRVRAAHIRSGGQVYRVAGLATAEAFAAADRNFVPSIRSFRELSEAESARIQPARVAFHVVRAGDTWESLARRAGPFGAPSPAALAIMNGSDVASPPRPGARVRIVIGG